MDAERDGERRAWRRLLRLSSAARTAARCVLCLQHLSRLLMESDFTTIAGVLGAATDAIARDYPGETGARQPVQTRSFMKILEALTKP